MYVWLIKHSSLLDSLKRIIVSISQSWAKHFEIFSWAVAEDMRVEATEKGTAKKIIQLIVSFLIYFLE